MAIDSWSHIFTDVRTCPTFRSPAPGLREGYFLQIPFWGLWRLGGPRGRFYLIFLDDLLNSPTTHSHPSSLFCFFPLELFTWLLHFPSLHLYVPDFSHQSAMTNAFAAFADSDSDDDTGKSGSGAAKAAARQTKSQNSKPKKEILEPSATKPKSGGGGKNNTRGGKGSGGGAGAQGGKRDHDRRSGTGRGKEVSKGGGGSR